MPTTLYGRKVLIVEDEYFIAQELSSALVALGASIVGPAGSLEQALLLLESDVHFAVLDINLKGETGFRIADILTARDIPFVFATGYDERIIPHTYRHIPRWEKPFDTQALAATLASLR